MKYEISLFHPRSGRSARAFVQNPIGAKNLHDHEDIWRPFILRQLRRLQLEGFRQRKNLLTLHWPQSIGWEWRSFVRRGLNVNFEGYAIVRNGMTQGLMKLERDFQVSLSRQPRRRVLYVAYLETAPWNNPHLVAEPRYNGVGSALLAAAASRSDELGLGGVIGLHSHPKVEAFYENCGLIPLGRDPKYEGQKYFEFTSKRALEFLSEKGWRP